VLNLNPGDQHTSSVKTHFDISMNKIKSTTLISVHLRCCSKL